MRCPAFLIRMKRILFSRSRPWGKFMETAAMGKVLVRAKIENLYDVERREQGVLPADQVHAVEVTDALVDTGATGVLLPKRLIALLGLRHYRTRQAPGLG